MVVDKKESLKWLENFGNQIGASFAELLELGAKMEKGEWITWGGGCGFNARDLFEDNESTFKFHYTNLTGRPIIGGFTCCY